MKICLAAAAVAAALAQPASAITFPSLTTIYVGSGVLSNSGPADTGEATTFHCTNVSGITATIRFLVLLNNGETAGSVMLNVTHGKRKQCRRRAPSHSSRSR